MFLRQSTSQIIRFGPCLDITDGVTEETALTLAQADMRLSKDGGAFTQKSAAGNATHDSDGWYSTTLSTTDSATVGILKLNVHQPANMFPVWETFYVVEEAVYDAMYGASAEGPLQATTAGRTLDILATGEVPIDFDTSIGTLAAAQIEASALDGKGDWNIGKTGYSLTQAFPANFDDMSITVTTGLVDITQTAADKVWGTAVRVLTAGTNIALAKGVGLTGLNDIPATDVVSAGPITTLTGAVVNVDTVDAVTGAVGSVTGAVGSVTGAVGSVTGSVGSVVADVTIDAASVDLIWDEVLSKATHDVSQSAGKRLREFSSVIIRVDTAQGPGTGNNQIQLDAGASAMDGAYDPALISIVSGTGLGQTRLILEYDGTSKTATVDRNWKVNPAADSEFVISGDAGRDSVNEGLAQGGTADTITLNTLASANNNVYIGQICFLRSGTGEDQAALIIAYNGTSKVATLDRNWSVNPDTTTGYMMVPASPVLLGSTTHTGAVIPTVTDVTTKTGYSADMTAISGSTTAADNLQRGAEALVLGAAVGTPTTTVIDTDLSETTDDHYVGRIVTFTTGNITGQSSDITAYNGTTKELTVTALTDAPSATDVFVIS